MDNKDCKKIMFPNIEMNDECNLEHAVEVLQGYGIRVEDDNANYRSVCDVMVDICRTFRFWRELGIREDEFKLRKYIILKSLVGVKYMNELY